MANLQVHFLRRKARTVGPGWPVNGQYLVALSGTEIITKERTPGKEIERFNVVRVSRTRRQAVGAEGRIDLGEALGSDRIAKKFANGAIIRF